MVVRFVGIAVTIIDTHEYQAAEAVALERTHDIIHCNNAAILSAFLERSAIPDIIGAHPYAPSKWYRALNGYYSHFSRV